MRSIRAAARSIEVDAAVVLLQRAHPHRVGGAVEDAVGGGEAGGRGGEARDALHGGGGADVGAVGAGAAATRAVDHEVDLARAR